MVSLEWMTQLWVEYSGASRGTSHGYRPAVNSAHCDPTAKADWPSQLVGLLLGIGTTVQTVYCKMHNYN
jgi:hypothetical protein